MGTNNDSLNKQTSSKADLLTKEEFIAWLLMKSHKMHITHLSILNFIK